MAKDSITLTNSLFGEKTFYATEKQASANPLTLIEKTVSDNGVYVAEDDNADGYSKVTVSVE